MKKDPEKIMRFSEKLRPFLPSGTEYYVASFIVEKTVHFTVSKSRKSKLGDYKHPWDGQPHKISVNGDLNRYAFLVTTIHEMAHLTTYEKYGNRVSSHGSEWRAEFKTLFQPVIERELLPLDVRTAVSNYLQGPRAASCSDDKLYRVLRRYDKKRGILVEHLKQGDVFEINGRVYQLGHKLRSRYECVELKTGRIFRVFGLAEVDRIIQTVNKVPGAKRQK